MQVLSNFARPSLNWLKHTSSWNLGALQTLLPHPWLGTPTPSPLLPCISGASFSSLFGFCTFQRACPGRPSVFFSLLAAKSVIGPCSGEVDIIPNPVLRIGSFSVIPSPMSVLKRLGCFLQQLDSAAEHSFHQHTDSSGVANRGLSSASSSSDAADSRHIIYADIGSGTV